MYIKSITIKKDLLKRVRKSRIYFFHSSETLVDNLTKNLNFRPVAKYKSLLPEVYEKIKIETGDVPCGATWVKNAWLVYRKFPGFIINGSYGLDIFVEV